MRNPQARIQKIWLSALPIGRKAVMAGLAISILYPGPAWASTAQDIAAASGGLMREERGALISKITNEKEFVPGFEHAVTAALRVCDASELIQYPFQYAKNGCVYEISRDKVSLLLSRQAYIQNWLEEHVPAIVPAGTDYNGAIRMLFDYIVSNYSYDYEAPGDFYAGHDSQGAYRILLTGQGICSGYSKLFRGMVEYLPFNCQGVVDYQAQEASHLSVALVSWSDGVWGHEWNAIQEPQDGLWYHYDLSLSAMEPGRPPLYKLSAAGITGDQCHGRISELIYEY